jgi:hypothetical protein
MILPVLQKLQLHVEQRCCIFHTRKPSIVSHNEQVNSKLSVSEDYNLYVRVVKIYISSCGEYMIDAYTYTCRELKSVNIF